MAMNETVSRYESFVMYTSATTFGVASKQICSLAAFVVVVVVAFFLFFFIFLFWKTLTLYGSLLATFKGAPVPSKLLMAV